MKYGVLVGVGNICTELHDLRVDIPYTAFFSNN